MCLFSRAQKDSVGDKDEGGTGDSPLEGDGSGNIMCTIVCNTVFSVLIGIVYVYLCV